MSILAIIAKYALIWLIASIAAAVIHTTAKLSWKAIKPLGRYFVLPSKLKPAK